jgi:hypothetical protein
MAMKTYKGSCHCGKVRFEAELDLSAGSSKCNCSICTKTRNWGVSVKPDAFRLLAGAQDLSDYKFTPDSTIHHEFCKHCGVRPFGRGFIKEVGGDFVSIKLCCLDEVAPEELLVGPVTYCDGRANNWWNPPAETRHL